MSPEHKISFSTSVTMMQDYIIGSQNTKFGYVTQPNRAEV